MVNGFIQLSAKTSRSIHPFLPQAANVKEKQITALGPSSGSSSDRTVPA